MLKNILIIALLSGGTCMAQQEFPLYTGKIPNSDIIQNEEIRKVNEEVGEIVQNVSLPTLTFYKAATGTHSDKAVIICPGGGYHVELINREGSDIAKAFNNAGISAFVLKYRLPNNRYTINQAKAPLQDVQQAFITIRQRADEWGLDSGKIGIMGFSAGGHLAATAGTHFHTAVIENPKGINLRPDFMILIYPVISFMDGLVHKGCMNNLLGPTPGMEEIRFYSNEYHVDQTTPPAFITHALDDSVVSPENSLLFYDRLRKNNVTTELHMYSKGEHGYLKFPSFDIWFGQCLNWLKQLYP